MPYPFQTKQAFLDNKYILPLTAFFVALVTFLVFLPSLRNGFVEWDDQGYVYNNELIRSVDPGLIKHIFTAPVMANWHPLTVFSFAIDYSIWGLDPWGYHLVNIAFHALNAGLVSILAYCLVELSGAGKTFSLMAGLVTALLFGVHPLHVESVAWVSERKDVLSTFFFILSVISYVKFASLGQRKALSYSLALISFILAVLSKPMAITLPAVLLIVDFYPLDRLSLDKGLSAMKVLIVEKIPFLAVIPVSAALTVWAQRSALSTLSNVPVSLRVFMAFRALVFYLYKMLLPFNLSPYYPYDYNPHPSVRDFLSYEYTGALALLLIITAFCIIMRKRHKFFLALWLFYIVTLMPVSGIVQVGGQAAADRYTYLSGLGPFMLVGLGAGWLATRDGTFIKLSGGIIIMAFLAALSVLTVRQIRVWRDTVSLWSKTISVFPESIPVVYLNRGIAYQKSGELKKSIEDFDTAIRLYPGYAEAYESRAMSYGRLSEHNQAVNDFTKAIELDPKNANAYHNRGVAHLKNGDYKKAVEDLEKAVELVPGSGMAHFNLGLAYAGLGDSSHAIENFRKASDLGVKEAKQYLDKYGNQ